MAHHLGRGQFTEETNFERFRESRAPSSYGTRDDLMLCAGDTGGVWGEGAERRVRISQNHRDHEHETSCDDSVLEEKSPLVKTPAAESAACSATLQLMALRDVLEECFHENTSEPRLSRQRSSLLQKLDVFKQINTSVRQQIKKLLDKEACLTEMVKQVKDLQEKMMQTERENQELKLNISEKEKKVEELRGLQGPPVETSESVVQRSRSLGFTQARLQGQLRNREAENHRLLSQLKDLERYFAQQKLEVQALRAEVASVSVTASEEKEALKKAIRAHKHRADKFEAAVEKCCNELRDKGVKLADARTERARWLCRQEEATEERLGLDAQITLLKDEVSALQAELQRERDSVHAASDILLAKIEKLNSEKAELNLHNSTLTATIVELEEKLKESEATLQDQTALAEKSKQEMEAYQCQLAELHVRVTELKITLESLHQETKEHRKDRADEVAQMEGQGEKLKSSLQMKDSILEANTQLQQEVASLQNKLEEVECENQKLIHRLASQEGAQQYSSRQLEERSVECQALRWQLEGALTDVAQQVGNVKEKACSRENAVLARVQELEAENCRQENELRQLQHSKLSSEKQFEMRLRDLQLSLDQSESHKRSIQNYLDFLKNSYTTMFEEVLPPYSSSYLLK
ncbi:outer dense fiber protein 2-like isoform X1 [Electrophorus electricus]|uniref:outer dense fiber protein 2-like isoform X1 n=1 Tax=Electrophorus electricus TaxID=8005 RepID=UPI0015D05DEE|nr:outer dense fiber protein 2-like isoform X1 [Electrophorus electricus]